MKRRHDPYQRIEPASGRDEHVARKRAKVELLERIEHRNTRGLSEENAEPPAEISVRKGSLGEFSALRLLAEVDLALSEHRSDRSAERTSYQRPRGV
mgnify:CR=1 FL=1